MRPADIRLLQETEIYQRLGADTAERLTRHCLVRDYPKNAVVTQQDDAAEYVHVVLRGRVALTAECLDGSNTIVTSFGDGELFVTAAAVLQLPHLVSARATAASRILLIPASRFRAALQSEPALALFMVDRLAQHWRQLVGHLRELKLLTAIERLANYLIVQSRVSHGPASFRLSEDRRTVAAQLGMRHECLSRLLRQLRSHGVQVRGSHVEIKDVARLTEIFQPVQRKAAVERADAAADRPAHPASGFSELRH